MTRNMTEEADWIESEVQDTHRKLRDDSLTGCTYAWAYGRLSVIAKHAESVIRSADPADGLTVVVVEEDFVARCRQIHSHHTRREPPRDGLHK